MFRQYSRIISAVVLFFFTWTSGGVFSVAHAAVDAAKKAKSRENLAHKKGESSEERLSKLTDDLRTALSDPKVDDESKRRRLSAAKSEIDGLDGEIRKQFAATEKRLKDAKLPEEILERHRKFVKHYDDNLAELKGNMDRVEKAADPKEAQAALEKTRQHLEKVQAPSRHHPLDPNNLPHRQRKAKKLEPRMKKEDFERDLKKDKHAWRNGKRVMVASIGSLAGTLQPDDLAETIEVQLTPEIRAKAQELGNNPVKIYEWVRNNIEFVPTWGSIQGAQMTLQTLQGNAFDTASLLIALLRAAGIHARYVTGTVQLPIDKMMNWLGGFSEPRAALEFMASGGVPVKAGVSGGKIITAVFEHIWVEACINYIPSRGAKHVNGKEDTWIALDPSYKQYSYTQGIDIKTEVPFNGQTFLAQVQAGATISDAESSVTGLNSLLVQQAMQNYQTQVQSFIQQNHPNATVGDIIGNKSIVTRQFPFLLGTMPYRTVVKGATFSSIPNSLRQQLSFNVANPANLLVDLDATLAEDSLIITRTLPELAGKKVTLSYSPASSQDEAVINSYLPTPHADGTPILSSEVPSSLPAYLINVVPQLRIDGEVVATGAATVLGGINTFTLIFTDPTYGVDQITSNVAAGEYLAIGLNVGRISPSQLTALKTKMGMTQTALENQNYSGLTRDDLMGDLLDATAVAYHAEYDAMNYIAARTMGVNAMTLPSEALFVANLKVMCLWGMPRYVSRGGLTMDAGRLATVVNAKDGNGDSARQYLVASGITSSALEHSVPEQLFSTADSPVEGISAVKALNIANDREIPIYTINQQNINNTLPQLQVDQQVKDEIKNAANAGKSITIPKTDITFNSWTGCGYIISDPETGAGAYKISGWLNGSQTEKNFADNILDYLRDPASNAWLGYVSGLAPVLGNVGVVLGLIILDFMIFFTITDILWNQDGTFSQKGKAVCTYLLIQSTEFFAGLKSTANPATFIAVLIINALYLELLNMMLQLQIKH